jgi:hypothetical protein
VRFKAQLASFLHVPKCKLSALPGFTVVTASPPKEPLVVEYEVSLPIARSSDLCNFVAAGERTENR